MTDQDIQADPFPGAERPTRRTQLKPFGADAAHALMVKEEALRKLTRQECFDRGYITVKDLDDEELRYGKCRDRNGIIPKNGKKTELIPSDRYDEMVAEHELRFNQKMRQNLDDMLEIMTDIAKDDTVEPRDRLEAAKYLFERVAGKTPERVNVTVTAKPWEELLGQVTGIAPMSRAEHRALNGAGIVDAEVVDLPEDEDVDADLSKQVSIPPQDVPQTGQDTAEQGVVQVHKPRPSEPDTQPQQATFVGEEPVHGEPYFERVDVPVGPDHAHRVDNDKPPRLVDDPQDHSLDYGRRADQKRTYADQVREAEELAKRRTEHRQRIQNAKKQRKIARVTGADAIKDEITGATLAEDGTLHFE